MDRYKIGSGTLSLIMERYHAGGTPDDATKRGGITFLSSEKY